MFLFSGKFKFNFITEWIWLTLWFYLIPKKICIFCNLSSVNVYIIWHLCIVSAVTWIRQYFKIIKIMAISITDDVIKLKIENHRIVFKLKRNILCRLFLTRLKEKIITAVIHALCMLKIYSMFINHFSLCCW